MRTLEGVEGTHLFSTLPSFFLPPLASCEHEWAQPGLRTPPACLKRRFTLLLSCLGGVQDASHPTACHQRPRLFAHPSPPDSAAEM